ncbi:CgeB family protein [Shewanella surugensis]|uniref:Glycosyltransferase n=1 Tax=Shewanella surugensis TaxID=212020 RepID=A0ABT0LHA4_9GAMM|nr:glycosyltransferase [Shewanella surugensis]MCL1126840.1 glycosyltransferase [Shewanella surugensis]
MHQKLKIAVIVDEATHLGLIEEAHLIHLTPLNWRWCINIHKPDLLFVESAWRGYKNTWQKKIVDLDKSVETSALRKLTLYCQKKSIPTVFWNKEDPIHFKRFAQAAILFNTLYTTDVNCIPRYQALDHHFDRISILMFAAQPKLHLVYPQQQRLSNIAFLGGFYGNEFPKRSEDQQKMLLALKQHQLVIFDRFWRSEQSCSFPDSLKENCRPAVSEQAVYSLYKRYQLYINFNTVQSSHTMLSRRVFELAACASPMLSTPSYAIKHIFGSHIVQIQNADSVVSLCHEYLQEESKRLKDAKIIQEIVLDQHTWKHRLAQIQVDIGFT